MVKVVRGDERRHGRSSSVFVNCWGDVMFLPSAIRERLSLRPFSGRSAVRLAYLLWEQGVVCSNHTAPTNKHERRRTSRRRSSFHDIFVEASGPVAQWIEQLPSKQPVVGSIPTGVARKGHASIFAAPLESGPFFIIRRGG